VIYLDHNATTPVDPAVLEAMLPYLGERFGNPSSTHALGTQAREAVEAARAEVAGLIGAAPDEIVFTSGGSESNTMAILGAARAGRGRHVVTSAVEHPAVLAPCRALEADAGFEVSVVGVDGAGRVDPEAVERALRPDTALVTVMLANNEVGTLQPVREIAARARVRGMPVHTDAAQAIGKVAVDVDDLGVDLLTIAGHKVYAPKGVGALYVRRGVDVPPLVRGASHEGGRRAGTENVPGIVGLGTACVLARRGLAEGEPDRLRALRDRLWTALATALPGLLRHGDAEGCLPNTLSVAFPGRVAADLLAALSDRVAASAGAACHAEGVTVSTVLAAMGVSPEVALATVRLSVGRPTTEADVDEAARHVVDAVRSA